MVLYIFYGRRILCTFIWQILFISCFFKFCWIKKKLRNAQKWLAILGDPHVSCSIVLTLFISSCHWKTNFLFNYERTGKQWILKSFPSLYFYLHYSTCPFDPGDFVLISCLTSCLRLSLSLAFSNRTYLSNRNQIINRATHMRL